MIIAENDLFSKVHRNYANLKLNHILAVSTPSLEVEGGTVARVGRLGYPAAKHAATSCGEPFNWDI